MSTSDMVVVFTSSNVLISANDNPLGTVQTVDIEDRRDERGSYTQIVLNRLVSGAENMINDMRAAPFIFKIFNMTNNSGYVAQEAELTGFKMSLKAKKDASPIEFLEQILTIRATNFVYVDDVRSITAKTIEKADVENMIKILKSATSTFTTQHLPYINNPVCQTITFDGYGCEAK